METTNIVKMFNEENLTLKDIAEKVGMSKSTVQRRLVADGWKYNNKTGKYEKNINGETSNNVSRETLNTETNSNSETINNETNVNNGTINTETNVSRETINIVNRTYGIPEDIDRALKIKCAIEGKKAVDVVREALKNVIEPKYFNLK